MAKSTSFSGIRPKLLDRALHELFLSLNTATAKRVSDLFFQGQHDALINLTVAPDDYSDAKEFRKDYLAVQILSKSDFLRLSRDPEEVALESFWANERKCAETNKRFRHLGPAYIGKAASVLETARRKISFVLGEFDPQEWFDGGRWGPGSSTVVKTDTSAEEKFRASRGITFPLFELVGDLLPVAYPTWAESFKYLQFEKGNKVTFVPKNAKTHRSIAIEPDFNIWFQLSLGGMVRRRLKDRTGIDLNTQSNNQSAARIGSILGSLATLDLKAASDTISYEVVRYLVSDDRWFHVLDASRSRWGTLNGATFYWEKFSSMGNGFTFELESLIFWAICAAACECNGVDPTVWVFGDDLVVPVECVAEIREALTFAGFTVNESKSFETGSFRESCGVHYFAGVDCQPIYVKKALKEIPDVYKLHNSVLNLAGRWSNPDGFADGDLAGVCRLLRMGVSTQYRVGVPAGIGDVGFCVPPSQGDVQVEVNLRAMHEHGWEGFKVGCWSMKPVKATVDHRGLLLARCFSQQFSISYSGGVPVGDNQEGSGNSYPLRGRTLMARATVFVTKWNSPKWFNTSDTFSLEASG